jgi:hypothetical protein
MGDVFEILGISSREDSYTDLIKNAFNDSNHMEFRRKVLTYFGQDESVADTAVIKTRESFSIDLSKGSGRKKIMPDMILSLPEQKVLLLIENKIFSSEGHQQTRDYASEEAAERIKNTYGCKNIEYYYMTLLGEDAEDKMFKPISWANFVVNTVKGCNFNRSYELLMNDLVKRANHLNEFNMVNLNEERLSIENLTEVHEGLWIDRKAIFYKWINTLNDKLNEIFPDIVPFITKAKGRSEQYLTVYNNKKWENNNLTDSREKSKSIIAKTRNVHIEANWNYGKAFMLYIHYESNPYLSQSEFEKQYPGIYSKFKEKRNQFKTLLHKTIDDSPKCKFSKANYKLTLAKYDVLHGIEESGIRIEKVSYPQFEKAMMEAFAEAYTLIENTLARFPE